VPGNASSQASPKSRASKRRAARGDPRRASPHQLDAQVLAVLADTDVPLGAYDIIAALHARAHGVAPPSVYRTLSRLIERGVVERIETISAYTMRQSDNCAHAICKQCGRVQGVNIGDAAQRISQALERVGFSPARIAIEATGACATCDAATAQTARSAD